MSTHDNTTAFEQWEVVELAASASRVATPAEDAETELARLREAARAEGYAEGVAAGRVEGEKACGRMKQLVESFSTTLDNLDFRLADMVLELALDVARQVVAGELAGGPGRHPGLGDPALEGRGGNSTRAPGGAGARQQQELDRVILGTPVDRSRHAIVIIIFA